MPKVKEGTNRSDGLLQTNNTSGIGGVFFVDDHRETHKRWIAHCYPGPAGRKQYHKAFYINSQRDYDQAKELAIEFHNLFLEAKQQGCVDAFYEQIRNNQRYYPKKRPRGFYRLSELDHDTDI